MKGTNLGEFQEVVMLSIMILGENAYGVTIQSEIQNRMNRNISRGALHTALTRLDEKGYIQSKQGDPTPERGGRRKRYYEVTASGISALKESKQLKQQMWELIPILS
ncbi:MAG: helix-turn-helix transcriptional regulator [bacterium]|nr:helix-turn-helix transcriptional regulator [bacterium]